MPRDFENGDRMITRKKIPGLIKKTIKRQVGKIYEIHDNGGRPFSARISGTNISVENIVDVENPKHIFSLKAKRVFIGGKSPIKPFNTEKDYKGNSILLDLGSRKYRYIGDSIYDFILPKDESIIRKFYSDVGNSDVPYPYAIGEKYIYILLEAVAIPIQEFNLEKDIYQQYYQDKSDLSKSDLEIKLKTKIIHKRAY